MADRIVMGYWDCEYCGTKKINGTTVDCPNCGHQRGKEVKFYMDLNNKVYVDNHKVKGPDWHCEFCNAYNPADSDKCENCGAPKGSKNYFDYNKDRKDVISEDGFAGDEHFNNEDREENTSSEEESTFREVKGFDPKNEPTRYEYDSTFDKFEDALGEKLAKTFKSFTSGVKSFPELLWNIIKAIFGGLFNFIVDAYKYIGILLLLISLFVIVFNLAKPKWYKLEITNLQWTNTIEVEELKTYREDDWSVPSGGRVVYTREEIHHYDKVVDHYNTVTKSRVVPDGGHYENETKTREVPCGSHEEVVGYSENGDGTFTEHTRTVTDYTTETYTESVWVQDYRTEYYTEQEPVYRDEPVYRTKYYYDIDRWVYERSVVTTGNDKEPYWGELALHEKERESTRYTTYSVTGNIDGKKGKEEKTYSISQEYWEQMECGSIINIKVTLGMITEWNND